MIIERCKVTPGLRACQLPLAPGYPASYAACVARVDLTRAVKIAA